MVSAEVIELSKNFYEYDSSVGILIFVSAGNKKDEGNFEMVKTGHWLVNFHETWCKPCVALESIWESVADELTGVYFTVCSMLTLISKFSMLVLRKLMLHSIVNCEYALILKVSASAERYLHYLHCYTHLFRSVNLSCSDSRNFVFRKW